MAGAGTWAGFGIGGMLYGDWQRAVALLSLSATAILAAIVSERLKAK